jgi:hypothetical protein
MQQFLRDNELGIDFIECARSLVGTHLEIAMQHALVEPIQERCASTNELFLQSILMGEFTIVCVCLSLSLRVSVTMFGVGFNLQQLSHTTSLLVFGLGCRRWRTFARCAI